MICRKISCAAIALTALFTVGADFVFAQNIKIDLPRSGWRNSQDEQLTFTQTVNYPASSVNADENQNPAALIKGHISSAPKNTEPYTLIVNGIPMPLAITDTTFERPYVFAPGSNNIEIRSPDRKKAASVQFYETYRAITQSRLRIVLSWDTDGTDLDLHVVSPDGQHCFYQNRVMANGGALDVDVTTGYGPEIYASTSPMAGTYMVFINYYGSGTQEDITVAQVTVVTHENTPDEKMQTFTVPMRAAGELTLVSTFVYP